MIQQISPEKSLIETIGTSSLSDLAVDAGELAIDALLKDGLLRDIPIINTVVNLAKTSIAIKDYLFLRKLISFLQHLENVPEQRRRDFVQQLASNKLKEQIGRNLILLLDRLDNMNKPGILGRVFKAYVEEKIDYLTFQKLCTAIDRIRYYDIPAVQQYYARDDETLLTDETLQDLVNCGLIAMNLELHTVDGQDTVYSRNKLGRLFVEIALTEGNE